MEGEKNGIGRQQKKQMSVGVSASASVCVCVYNRESVWERERKWEKYKKIGKIDKQARKIEKDIFVVSDEKSLSDQFITFALNKTFRHLVKS